MIPGRFALPALKMMLSHLPLLPAWLLPRCLPSACSEMVTRVSISLRKQEEVGKDLPGAAHDVFGVGVHTQLPSGDWGGLSVSPGAPSPVPCSRVSSAILVSPALSVLL